MKIISGGQVGADIAALRVAKKLGFETGGWAPKGWVTKNGPMPQYAEEYGMTECHDGGYPERTRMNVMSSDCTIRIASNWKSYGELCTLRWIRFYNKPYHDIHLNGDLEYLPQLPRLIAIWIEKNMYETINVSGNSTRLLEPVVERFLMEVFK